MVPWSGGPVETLADARRHAERLGYPRSDQGHGRRRRPWDSPGAIRPDELEKAFESARAEAFKAFGDPTVFMSSSYRCSPRRSPDHRRPLRHDLGGGRARLHHPAPPQKVLEEAPSPALSPEQDQTLREAAVRLSQAAGYHNAGTVEFLYRPAEPAASSFMEMNTRLQVEHPVTECTTGLDLVKLQIHVARGGRLEGEPPRPTGHAIEVRLNAEDPDNGFAPAPGMIERFRILTGPGVRIDTGVAEGDSVPAEFDSMIAKIIAYGQTRKEALARLQRALRESGCSHQGRRQQQGVSAGDAESRRSAERRGRYSMAGPAGGQG